MTPSGVSTNSQNGCKKKPNDMKITNIYIVGICLVRCCYEHKNTQI